MELLFIVYTIRVKLSLLLFPRIYSLCITEQLHETKLILHISGNFAPIMAKIKNKKKMREK